MRNLILFFSLIVIMLATACTKQENTPDNTFKGSLIEVKFIGSVPNGSQIMVDDMKFTFQVTDTTLLGERDPLTPIVSSDDTFSISLPASKVYRRGSNGWRSEQIEVNMMPYHFAVAFNVLKVTNNLADTYELIGNTTTAILSSAVRVKNSKGETMSISASDGTPVQITVIEP